MIKRLLFSHAKKNGITVFNFKSHIGRASASGCNKQKVSNKQMSNGRILIAIVPAIPAVQNGSS
jgi:hypothetical protein